ncbi:MAG: glycosyltransferase family 87 protein [Candidatus Dormibacteraceae bacterium]
MNLVAVGLSWFLVLGGGFIAWNVIAVPLSREILDNDLTLAYIGARIGIEHGWNHLYSLSLQGQLFRQLRPSAPFNDGERFISPPPSAWVLVPLMVLGAAGTVYVWLVASVAALVAAWWMAAPGSTRALALWLIAALAWYPVQYSLSLAQPDLIVLLAAVACWKLAENGRLYLAGAVLGVSVLKPQLTLAVPLVLLVAGRWRIAAAWAVTVGVLAVVSLLAIGQQGLSDYRMLLAGAEHVANNRYFTPAYIFGAGPLSYAAQAVLVAIGLAGAYVNRRASLARLFAIGLVTSTLGATYWHLQDYAILVGAAWLFWRDPSPGWQRWWLVVVAVGGELGWALTPLPILVGLTVWVIYLALSQPRALRTAEAR